MAADGEQAEDGGEGGRRRRDRGRRWWCGATGTGRAGCRPRGGSRHRSATGPDLGGPGVGRAVVVAEVRVGCGLAHRPGEGGERGSRRGSSRQAWAPTASRARHSPAERRAAAAEPGRWGGRRAGGRAARPPRPRRARVGGRGNLGGLAGRARPIGRRPPHRRTDRSGAAEAAQDGASVGVEQHMGGLHRGVDHAGTVEPPEGGGHGEADAQPPARAGGPHRSRRGSAAPTQAVSSAGGSPPRSPTSSTTPGPWTRWSTSASASRPASVGTGLLDGHEPLAVPDHPHPLAHGGRVWTRRD